MARLAQRQRGVVGGQQLKYLGVSAAGISRWTAQGRLHRVHPGVYAVGHSVLDVGGRLTAALLYAGREAALSHQTGAWWWRVLEHEPQTIHLSAPGDRRSLPDVRIHHPRRLEVTRRDRFPVTTLPRTLLDIAGVLPFADLRRAVAEADYRRLLDLTEIETVLGRGRPGSAALRAALAIHRPELARTLSVLEERFLGVCERHEIPMPEVNAAVVGLMVDCLWRHARVIVELDGHKGHGYPAAIEQDRRREMALRGAGYAVLRYTWAQVTRKPERVATDLRAALNAAANPN